MGKAISIQLTTEEKAKLESTLRSAPAPVRDVLRSRIVLLAAAGRSNQEIAVQLGIHRHSVALWRRRFARQGLPGLEEKAGLLIIQTTRCSKREISENIYAGLF